MTSQRVYQPGDVVNGYRLSADGSRWDPVGQPLPEGLPASPDSPGQSTTASSVVLPTSRLGWVAVVASAIGLGSWILLPLLTGLREQYPVTDTVVMPIIGLVLTLIAAVINVLAVWPGKQRSVLNILGAVLTVGVTLFFGVFVIGDVLGGA
jgi:hypothetical protein